MTKRAEARAPLFCPRPGERVLTQRRKDAETQRSEPEKIPGKRSHRSVTGCEGNLIRQFFASLRLGVFALKNLKADGIVPEQERERPQKGGGCELLCWA
jgi:hypothetical protein